MRPPPPALPAEKAFSAPREEGGGYFHRGIEFSGSVGCGGMFHVECPGQKTVGRTILPVSTAKGPGQARRTKRDRTLPKSPVECLPRHSHFDDALRDRNPAIPIWSRHWKTNLFPPRYPGCPTTSSRATEFLHRLGDPRSAHTGTRGRWIAIHGGDPARRPVIAVRHEACGQFMGRKHRTDAASPQSVVTRARSGYREGRTRALSQAIRASDRSAPPRSASVDSILRRAVREIAHPAKCRIPFHGSIRGSFRCACRSWRSSSVSCRGTAPRLSR